MSWFADSSIRGKLIALQLLTTLAVLALYGVFTVVNETRLHRAALMRKSETLAQMIATNCTAPLDFVDASAAEEILSSAEADEDVVNAWIYDAEGGLFAKYSRPGSAAYHFPPMKTGSDTSERGFLTVSSEIVKRGENLGVVSIRLNMEHLRTVGLRSGVMAALALAIGMGLAFLLALVLQRAISAPIHSLVDVVRRVSDTGDCSIRVNIERNDEIGVLCDGFDDMLQRIHQREEERNEAEATLRESERKYRELVENANSIILRWGSDGRITFLNEFGQRFFGYSESEILGRHVVGSIVPEAESAGRDMRPLMDRICADPVGY